MRRLAGFLCFIALAGVSANASTIVYDDSGPGSFQTDAWVITDGFSVADSFSLSAPATIDAISFGNWLNSGDTLESVNWEIITAPNGGTTVGSGTVTAFSNVPEGNPKGLVANDSTFTIGSLSLAAGTTYYLEFSNSVSARGEGVFWDESDNPHSTPYIYDDGVLQSQIRPDGPDTFALYGSSSPVPEPSSLLLLCSGLTGLALIGIMRRRAVARTQTASCAKVRTIPIRYLSEPSCGRPSPQAKS